MGYIFASVYDLRREDKCSKNTFRCFDLTPNVNEMHSLYQIDI